MKWTVVTALLCLVTAPAMAYVGPGAGLTLLSALWGLLVAVLAAMVFLVLWPIRRWRRRRQEALETGEMDDEQAPPAVEARRNHSESDGR